MRPLESLDVANIAYATLRGQRPESGWYIPDFWAQQKSPLSQNTVRFRADHTGAMYQIEITPWEGPDGSRILYLSDLYPILGATPQPLVFECLAALGNIIRGLDGTP